jgi:Predicted membrane protein
MNNAEFLEKLKKALRRLPHEEYNAAITYYEEYFAEGGEIKETPEQVSREIFANFAADDTKPVTAGRVRIIILSICGIPILLPIAAVIFALGIAAYSVIFALFAAAVGIAVGGFSGGILSLQFIISDLPSTLFFFGFGLFCAAGGIALFVAAIKLSKEFTKLLLNLLHKALKRVKK